MWGRKIDKRANHIRQWSACSGCAVTPDRDTVWLTQDQMSMLFDTARSSIAYHIGNIFREGELDKDTSVEIFDRSESKASRPPAYYNLDVIISVGYRVKSQRGVEFRRWANAVLKQYILNGYAINQNVLPYYRRRSAFKQKCSPTHWKLKKQNCCER